MSGPRPDPFEPLEPPRAGLATLRARIERDSRRRTVARRAWSWGTVAVVASLVVLVLVRPVPRRAAPTFPVDFLVGTRVGLVDLPDEPVTIAANRRHLSAVLRVPMPDDEIVFYRVASLAPSEPDESPAPPMP